MSDFDDLMRLLRGQRAAAEWVGRARARVVGAVRRRGGDEDRRIDERTELDATVHRDLPGGRGSAQCAMTGGALAPVVAEAIDRAAAALGPSWRMATPAAPAQVATADAALGERRADEAAAAIAASCEATARSNAPALTRLAGAEVAIAEVVVEVEREHVDVGTSQGLHVRWEATEARVALLLVSGNRTTWARARARRLADLRLAELLATAAERLGGLAQAAPPPPGMYPVVLRLAALAPDDGSLGVWAGFAAQADAALVRHGLSRYRPGHPVTDGAAADPEPLTITSDGTLPYGLASAPLGDQGEPVRRFVVVERGVARELAYDQREAGLAGVRPNGGVRNLIVAPGATPAAALAAAGPVLDIASLAWIELDPRTAQLSAGVEYGTLRDGDRAQPITGAVIRGDAIAALAHGQRSADTAVRGAYQGPIAIRTPPLEVA